jgi:hypothetical protein
MTGQQLTLDDYAQAVSARDAGMALAELAETMVQPDFSEAAYAAICHVARRQAEVHIDDLLRHLKVKPSHPNCMGQIWRRAIKEGVISHSGRVRACVSDKNKRAHLYPIYSSGLFHGRPA